MLKDVCVFLTHMKAAVDNINRVLNDSGLHTELQESINRAISEFSEAHGKAMAEIEDILRRAEIEHLERERGQEIYDCKTLKIDAGELTNAHHYFIDDFIWNFSTI